MWAYCTLVACSFPCSDNRIPLSPARTSVHSLPSFGVILKKRFQASLAHLLQGWVSFLRTLKHEDFLETGTWFLPRLEAGRFWLSHISPGDPGMFVAILLN